MAGRALTLSGELGSGKSEVSARLARALGARRVSTGEAQRAIADSRGVSTLELNRLAESDPTIDDEIDGVFRSLAATPDPLVVDSRMAWHFLPRSYKVHLVVDPVEGATRVLGRTGSHAEHYESVTQALAGMEQRVESERRRFLRIYGVDIFDLRNYDLVVDTSQAPPSEVADAILSRYREPPPGDPPALLVAPRRVRGLPDGDGEPSAQDAASPEGAPPDTAPPDDGPQRTAPPAPVVVVYRRPELTVVGGERRLRAEVRAGARLVPAVLRDDALDVPPDPGGTTTGR